MMNLMPWDNDSRDKVIDAVLYGCVVVLVAVAVGLIILIV